MRIHRTDTDAYDVYLRWNVLALQWQQTSSAALAQSSIATILAALGTDLDHILDQPIRAETEDCGLRIAA